MASTTRPSHILTDQDLYLWNEGSHRRPYDKLGAHPAAVDGTDGVAFAVWAPSARSVSVVGDFNGWDPTSHPLAARASSGIWEGHVPGAEVGDAYKFSIEPAGGGPR